ncbi:MAG: TonB-dependent receptor [Deltaproteobacteria bacterium]
MALSEKRTTILMGKRFLILLLIIIFSSGHGLLMTVHGEEPETEELGFIEIEDVYAAAKHLQSVKQAPASISLVTDEDIKRHGYRTLTDAVNNVRSFYSYSDRNYEYIGVRGFARLGDYGNRVLQLVDGHSQNDNIYGSFFMGHSFGVDMDLVKKIEFIRGPGSSLYGNNAAFGVVNVITKSGKDINGLYAKIEGGSYNTYSGGIAYGKQFRDKHDLLISASFVNSKGQDLHYPEFMESSGSTGWARDSDGEKARKFLMKAILGEVTFLANAVSREKIVPTAVYGSIFNDNRLKTIDEKIFAEVKWEHPLADDKNLKTRIFYDWYRFQGEYPFDSPPVVVNRDEVVGQSIGGEAVYDQRISSHLFLIGADVIHHLEATQKNYDESPYLNYLDDHRTFTTWSVYGQDEWDITSWLRFTGGLRFDQYSTFGRNLSPRAGLILTPIKTNAIKLLYGQAFRAPNVYELYYATNMAPSLYRANPDLKPEIIDTFEIVVEQELSPTMKAIVSGFHYIARDLINQEQNADGSMQFYNVSKVKSDGVELGLEINWPGFLKGDASYTYQDTRDEETGRWLANSPRHMVKVGARISLYKNILFLGGQCRYMGNRLDREGMDVGDAFITDINLSAEYKKLTLSAAAYNLLDAHYADPVSTDHVQKSIPQNGRNFWLKIGYVF